MRRRQRYLEAENARLLGLLAEALADGRERYDALVTRLAERPDVKLTDPTPDPAPLSPKTYISDLEYDDEFWDDHIAPVEVPE